MRITTKSRYALRAVFALAGMLEGKKSVSISCLSEREGISAVFLEQIFFKLRKAGIVDSVRGPGGGFFFTEPLDSLTIKSILVAVGEELDCFYCKKGDNFCIKEDLCYVHPILRGVSDLVKDYLGNLTVGEVIRKAKVENPALLAPDETQQDFILQ